MAPDQRDPVRSKCRRLHSPGRPLAGGRNPDRESRMVVVDISFVTVDWFLGVSRLTDWLASGRVGTGVQPLQGENYMYSRVLSLVQLLIRLHFYRVVLLVISTSL